MEEGVDCVLRGGTMPDSRLSAGRVGDLRFVLCAAPQHIDRHGLPGAPDDRARHFQVGYVLASTGRLRPVTLLRERLWPTRCSPPSLGLADREAAVYA